MKCQDSKPRPPVTAHLRFAERATEFADLPIDEVFTRIHDTNLWGSDDSVSGLGSEITATAHLREELPGLMTRLGAKTLLDLPCGDFEWMSRVEWPAGLTYIGGDIVATLIRSHRRRWPHYRFEVLDLCASTLPTVDVVLCRDCLVHLSEEQIRRAIANLKRSGSTWLLTTTFPGCEENLDIQTGDWRMLNFELEPWSWPKPERLLVEGCQESGGGYEDKSLGLWRIDSLPA